MASSQPSFFKKITYTEGIYPDLKAEVIQNPNRFYAFPLIGLLVKQIILIPVLIEAFLLSIWWAIVVMLVNPFTVLFTGKYWRHAYQVTVGLMKLWTKTIFYMGGLTDKYPGFGFSINDKFSFDIPYPEKPRRLYAIPILGELIRLVLLIPYGIFANIINNAAIIGAYLLAWAVVLFKGRYPEGIFELTRDSTRTTMSQMAYFAGLSDRYPSFYISMAHDKIKLILIGISITLIILSFSTNS